MSSLFGSVLRQAFKTFDRSNQAMFSVNFELLKQLTEQLTFRDMHLSQQKLLNDAVFARVDQAPCTFLHIFENDVVSMSVFVMRAGYTMPLHDHPMMQGLLRCIFGQLRVQSYTQQLAPGEPLIYDRAQREVYVVAEEPCLVGTETQCAVLTPYERNFHEITALDGVAAFFDILSPPYDADIPVYGTRRCRFYRAKPPLVTQLYKMPTASPLRLERISAPANYYCDTADAPETLLQCTYIYASEKYGAS